MTVTQCLLVSSAPHVSQYQPVGSLFSSNSILLTIPPTKQLPQLVLFASPPKLCGIVCHLQSESSDHNLNFCADRMDIFFGVSLFEHGYQATLYHCCKWLWIKGAEYKSSDWIIDWLIIYLFIYWKVNWSTQFISSSTSVYGVMNNNKMVCASSVLLIFTVLLSPSQIDLSTCVSCV